MTYNPDAPVENTGGFAQHTYQPPQNDMFYWSGAMGAFGPNMGYNDGSRRNTMNPVNPFAQFGQNQPQAIPEQAVQPFSSYPPSAPMAAPVAPQPMGLNSMVESRRNVPPTPVGQNNPWAQPQQATPQYPVQPTYTQVPGQMPMAGWFDPNMGAPGFKIDMNTMALYGGNTFGFDKHNSWENYYTQNRPIGAPNINWQAAPPQLPPGYAAYQQPAAQYPMSQFPTSQQSWKDIAERNWAGQNI